MRIEPQTITHLQEWLGKTETLQDIVTAAPVKALSATLDRPDPAPNDGTFLPELWHWLYFLPCALQSESALTVILSVAAFYLLYHYRVVCGRVVAFNG